MVAQLDRIKLASSPVRSSDPAEYQRNVEDWAREVERTIRTYEDKLRELISLAVVYTGSGSPEGVVTAPVGSLYGRTNGGAATTLYVKESGTGPTGWVAK